MYASGKRHVCKQNKKDQRRHACSDIDGTGTHAYCPSFSNRATKTPVLSEENSCHLSHFVYFSLFCIFICRFMFFLKWKSLVASCVSFQENLSFMDVPAILMLLAVSVQLWRTTGKQWSISNIDHQVGLRMVKRQIWVNCMGLYIRNWAEFWTSRLKN